MTTGSEIFRKEYGGDDINDLERDVSEAFDADYNQAAKVMTYDEHGFIKGKLVVTITWVPEDDNS